MSASKSSSCALVSSSADRSRPSKPPSAPATSGKRRIESRRAPISRGVARPSAARPASRSRSRTPSSASRNRSRPRPSPISTPTASSRALMAAGSTSGASSQRRSSRPPIGVRVKLPGFAHGYGGARRRNRHLCRQYHLARLIAGDCLVDLGGGYHFQDQLTGGDIQGCEPRGRAAGINRYHIVVAVFDQPIISQHGAGRDRFDHGSADDALGQLGIFDLLTDRDPMPLGDETPEVFGRGLHGNTRERHLGSTAVIA